MQSINDTLIKVLFEFERVKMLADHSKQIAERDQQILFLRLEAALKNDTRALPPGSSAPPAPDTEARIAALEKEVAELKAQFAALEKPE